MRVLWLSLAVIVVDQLSKVLIRMNMYLGESIPLIGSWMRFTYTENPGMAFGVQVGPKVIVTSVALVATMLILVYLYKMRRMHAGYRLSLAAIFGGAVGNIIDRIFYAKFFNYGTYFEGQVVDFIHVDLWQGILDIPLLGPRQMALLPIGNVADIAIVTGVIAILIFHRRFQEAYGDLPTEADVKAEQAKDGKVAFVDPAPGTA